MFTAKLRKDLENTVMDAIAEWEYQKHVIAYYTFEINAIDAPRARVLPGLPRSCALLAQ